MNERYSLNNGGRFGKLSIHLFGGVHVYLDGVRVEAFATRKAELLFSFLVLNRNRLFLRDVLADRFFSNESKCNALKRLRTIIWQIRSALKSKNHNHEPYLIITSREIGFNKNSYYWLDNQEFEATILSVAACQRKPLQAAYIATLTKALALYRGDFLEGVFDDWCIWERERLKRLNLKGREILMENYASNSEWQDAIVIGEQLINEDPLREHIHRRLMRYDYLAGDRPSAIIRYEKCKKLLNDELNIEPMRKTKNLYREIKNDLQSTNRHLLINSASIGNQSRDSAMVEKGLSEIYSVVDQLETLNTKLAYGIELLQGERNKLTR